MEDIVAGVIDGGDDNTSILSKKSMPDKNNKKKFHTYDELKKLNKKLLAENNRMAKFTGDVTSLCRGLLTRFFYKIRNSDRQTFKIHLQRAIEDLENVHKNHEPSRQTLQNLRNYFNGDFYDIWLNMAHLKD